MNIDTTIKDNKEALLAYFRDRASEYLTAINLRFAEHQSDKKARAINENLNETKNQLINTVLQHAERAGWSPSDKLEVLLMISYCNIVVMFESRNAVRPYEYMDFSRRAGELWDQFCKLCFYYPLNDISLFVPPLFSEVKKTLVKEIVDYIDKLIISKQEKDALRAYYDKVWSLVSSGEIQLELDLHFVSKNQKHVVDFKSGFGSNEKGNTNRLLLVASVYRNLPESYKCLLLVRSEENNSYFNTLKKSGIWEVYSGIETYEKIKDFSGYDLKKWTHKNMLWADDFRTETADYFRERNLLQYLEW